MEAGDVLEAIPLKNVSYLYARDPSIIAGSAGIANSRKNLIPELGEATTASAAEPDSETLTTYLRIKASYGDDGLYTILDQRTVQCKIPDGSYATRNVKEGDNVTKKYVFTKIFSGDASQTQLFCEIVKPKMLKFLNGYNYTLLSYGASGSGKTYTIVGTAEEPGLIPRALEYVFRSLPPLPDEPNIKLKSNGTIIRKGDSNFPKNDRSFREHLLRSVSSFSDYNQHIKTYREMQKRLSVESVAVVEVEKHASLGVFVSFAEIYNEFIYDLLTQPNTNKPREKLHLGNCNGTAYIKNLTMVPVSTGLQAFQILQYGLRNLNYAATRINDHSSRSHCIFTIKLVQASAYEEGYSVSYFNFCDLAGSERVKKTLNVGDRLKESNNINTSLLVLGRCITAVRDSQKHKDARLIPFRESKLTQLFKRALSGLEDISMIVNINPTRDMFDESHHVLNFSAIAKDIIIDQPQIVKGKKKNRFSDYMQSRSTAYPPISEENENLQAEVHRLTNLVAQLEYENACLNQEALQIEQEARQEVIKVYKEILKQKEESHQRHINALQTKYEDEIARLKYYYEKQKQEEIVNLDSSDDSANSSLELQGTLFTYKAELQEKDKILEDAVSAFKEVQEEVCELKKENLKLLDELEIYKNSSKALHPSDESTSADEQESDDWIQNGKEAAGRKTFVVNAKSTDFFEQNGCDRISNHDEHKRPKTGLF